MKKNNTVNDIIKLINESDELLILGHVSPDGDTCGSCAALALALLSSGKHVTVAMDGGLPVKYSFLGEYIDFYSVDDLPQKNYDCALAVDVADLERLYNMRPAYFACPKHGCIDHHISNTYFAEVTWVEQRASAGELVFELIERMGLSFDKPIANSIFTALNTDTGNFSYSNTDAACLGVASRLAAYGADIPFLHDHIYGHRTLAATKILGRALASLELHADGKIALMSITQEDLKACGARSEDCDSIVNYARDIDGTEIGVLVRENIYGAYKLSFRSNKYADVGALAAKFGGGGHLHAAGGTSELALRETIESIIKEARETL